MPVTYKGLAVKNDVYQVQTFSSLLQTFDLKHSGIEQETFVLPDAVKSDKRSEWSQIRPEKRGGLKGSTQHWPAVYPPEFEIPRFVVAGY